ncbi:MAG: glutamate-5-semialdehyde dehydrogenase [Methylocystaceae bacterium]
MGDINTMLRDQGLLAKQAARMMATASSVTRNQALTAMANALRKQITVILAANQEDIEVGRQKGMSGQMLDRLLLTEQRVEDMAVGLETLVSLPDPLGEVVAASRRPNGLEISQIRVPLGVVGLIYEARPNVTADAAGICIKTGNAIMLRGGSEAINSNRAIVDTIAAAAVNAGMPTGAIQLVASIERESATQMMRLNGLIDVLIPRGGAGLIRSVVENATVPVIETGVGNCHVYVDKSADLKMAQDIVFNAKVQRPSVCNAAETLLVHQAIAREFLPAMIERLQATKVEVRGCEITQQLGKNIVPATEEDFATEFLQLILAVKVVADLEEAINHIQKYGSGHTEAIVTNDYQNSRRFTHEIDAACVMVNASTRFTDGFQFGLGAEMGISTQKLHARGPMGLKEMTTTKYVVNGDGQIRT